jgi:hypothetical protein
MIFTISTLKANGFDGFISIHELKLNCRYLVPSHKGVYVVISTNQSPPEFLQVSTGGKFKDKDPSVDIDLLKQNWVDDAEVLYIGKAGSNTSKATLQSRIKQYLDFGTGKPVGHWGGRYIWQLSNADDLLIAWKVLDDDPRQIEKQLIQKFRACFGSIPFANLVS